jgi:hypothetical protein
VVGSQMMDDPMRLAIATMPSTPSTHTRVRLTERSFEWSLVRIGCSKERLVL